MTDQDRCKATSKLTMCTVLDRERKELNNTSDNEHVDKLVYTALCSV